VAVASAPDTPLIIAWSRTVANTLRTLQGVKRAGRFSDSQWLARMTTYWRGRVEALLEAAPSGAHREAADFRKQLNLM
jgi:hypothetical protein